MSDIITFPSKPTADQLAMIAMGRSRKAALPVIMNRLRELRRQGAAAFRPMLIGGRETTVEVQFALVGNAHVEFLSAPSGTYFCILVGPDRVMTGYLDHKPFAGCALEDRPMSWKRGPWQAELFKHPRGGSPGGGLRVPEAEAPAEARSA
jgi:hypothetical protein